VTIREKGTGIAMGTATGAGMGTATGIGVLMEMVGTPLRAQVVVVVVVDPAVEWYEAAGVEEHPQGDALIV
jgi:hypothetical protein